MNLYYSDAHTHTNPIYGLGAERIAKKFKGVGGWFMALVSLPPYHYGFMESGIEAYRKTIDLLVSEAGKIREAGLKVRVLAGFHPAEVDEYFRRGMKLGDIIELAESVIKLIVGYHRRGLIDGIGEVGRQHYSTAPARLVVSEIILLKAMEAARDNDMIMHLHLEQGGFVTVESIKYFTSFTSINKNRVFLHHVTINEALWAEKYGFNYTVPAKYRSLKRVFEAGLRRVLVESDHIDDPKRPGVSSYPWDIPVRIKQLIDEGIINEETVHRVMVDNIVETYDVTPP